MGPPSIVRVQAPFVAVPGVLVDGQETRLRVDATGALVTSLGGGGVVVAAVTFVPPSSFNTGGTPAASGVIRATPGTLLDVNGTHLGAAVAFFQLFNTVAVPANGTVPIVQIRVPTLQNFSISFADSQGMVFGTGISWAHSTTSGILTLGAAEMTLNAQHRAP